MKFGVKIYYSIEDSSGTWTTCYHGCSGHMNKNGDYSTNDINIAFKHRELCHKTASQGWIKDNKYIYRVEEIV